MVARMSDQLGRVLGGRYRLVAAIGTGASAQVFLADDVTLHRRVAVKVLHPALATDEAFLRRFRGEARAAAQLSHPNLMAVYDWGEDDGPYLVLEYLGGGSLRTMLDRSGTLSAAQALMIGLEAARALDVAHRRGFVHRDIKPANLLFGEDGRLRIADFGLARALSEAGWTEPGDGLVGTARYAAPEQARGGRIDGKADVYALGLVLIEAVTGSVPLVRESALETMMARVDTAVDVPEELGRLRPVLARAGRPDPAERPDAAQLGQALVAAARQMERPAALPLAGIDGAGGGDDVTVLPGEGFDGDGDLTVYGRHDPTGVLPPVAGPPAPGASERAGKTEEPEVARAGKRRRWPWVLLAVLVAAAVAAGGLVMARQMATPTAPVPDVATQPLARAHELIERADRAATDVAWTVEEDPRYDDNVAPGVVVRQMPLPGAKLADGGVITLVVSRGPHPVALPAMDDATIDAAKAAVEAAGLAVGAVVPRHDEVVPAGQVITWSVGGAERPAQAPLRSAVDFVVSAGPEPRTIPDLRGRSEADAAGQLGAKGLKVARAEEFSDDVGAGLVVRTNPPAGKTVNRGDTVTIVVSKGQDLVTVPDVTGLSAEDAAAKLEAAGLTVDRVEGPFRGKVYTTDPGAGNRVKRGTSVDLYLKR